MLPSSGTNSRLQLAAIPQVFRGAAEFALSDSFQSTTNPSENSHDSKEDLRICCIEEINLLCFEPLALIVGKHGFVTIGSFMMMQPFVIFSVILEQRGAGAVKCSAYISASHILEIVHTAGTGGKNFLAFALDESGRKKLPKELHLYHPEKRWDLFFYIAIDQSYEDDFVSRLIRFFGSRVRHVVPSEWNGMPELVSNIVLVKRFTQSLEIKHGVMNMLQNVELESQPQSDEYNEVESCSASGSAETSSSWKLRYLLPMSGP